MNIEVTLTRDELELVLEALDSHAYWQLSDELYRSSGFVLEPGSNDPEDAAAIRAVQALSQRLEALRAS